MKEEELKTFIDVVVSYFEQTTGEAAEMGVPYIKNHEAVVLDYTGIIGISGARKGGIYLTASKPMLSDIAEKLLGTKADDDDTISDMAGELCNTIAGNVRSTFGSSFLISVPMVLQGSPHDIMMKMHQPVFIIPIQWKTHQSYLVVGLE